MKIFRHFFIFLLSYLCVFSSLSVCSSASADNVVAETLTGKWAYIHDPDTPALIIKANGKAELDGKKYTYTNTDEYIEMTDKKGTSEKFRYKFEKDGLYFYKNCIYVFCGEDEPTDIVGQWKCEDNNWSFEFTANGTFNEDGFFPGYYSLNQDSSEFTLIYNDHFEDTTCYYSIEGNELHVSYPWLMVRIK